MIFNFFTFNSKNIAEKSVTMRNLSTKIQRDVEGLLRKLKSKEWEYAKNIGSGILDEMFSTGLAIGLYPLGLGEWILGNQTEGKIKERLDKAISPVLLVHGYVMNSSNFLLLRKRLSKDGWKYLYSINLKTHKRYIEEMAEDLSLKVEKILENKKGGKINLVAHSLGGLVSRFYVQFLKGWEKVNTLITLGTPHQGTELYFVGPFKSAYQMNPRGEIIRKLNEENLHTLNKIKLYSIWSPFDYAVVPPENAVVPFISATNIRVDFVGHLGLLFNKRVAEITKFLLKKNNYSTKGRKNKNEKSRPPEKSFTEKGILGEKI